MFRNEEQEKLTAEKLYAEVGRAGASTPLVPDLQQNAEDQDPRAAMLRIIDRKTDELLKNVQQLRDARKEIECAGREAVRLVYKLSIPGVWQ